MAALTTRIKLLKYGCLRLKGSLKNTKIDFYTVMPNHIHFIMFNSGTHNLPEIIDWFKTMTTNEYIKGVKNGLFPRFDKHVWQRSYYEHVIRNEDDLYEIRKYII